MDLQRTKSNEVKASLDQVGQKLLGIFELDDSGNVLYSSTESENGSLSRDPKFEGTNFFNDLARFNNKTDFQRRFDFFRLADMRTMTFAFTCEYADEPVMIKVVMARLLTGSDSSFLVHVQKA